MSSGLKKGMVLLPKLKQPKVKSVVIEPASPRKACSNINSSGSGSGGTGKSRPVGRSVPMTMRIRTFWRFYYG